MGITTAYSSQEHLEGIIQDIQAQTRGITPKLVLYCASSKFNAEAISLHMQQSFPNTPVFGCSTAGEIVSGKMLKGSVVAMLFDEETIEDVTIEVIEQISTENRVPEALQQFERYYGTSMEKMDYTRYVGIILLDGLSLAEERIMEKIGDLTNVTFIGGSAGDDLQFQKTHVYANGRAYTNAAVLALMKPKTGFDVIKTQSFCPLNKKLMATKVDEANRKVLEFNEKPAVEMYAGALNIPVEQVADSLFLHPVGLMIGDEPYVRSPQNIQDQCMTFYANIKEGMELNVLESTDIIADTTSALNAKIEELGGISGVINFHCILRTLELEQKGLTEAYGQIFSEIPTIGFSTYGEEYIGHVNQTSTMLVFT